MWIFRSSQWGWGVGNRAQSLAPCCLVGSGGGFGAGLNGDCGQGVPACWVGLAGGGGGLPGVDDGALGDEDVDEGLDGVVLGARLCGGGSRWGGGGGAQVVVGGGSWFGLVFGLGRCRLGCRRCFCVVGGCVGWCWWWCCCCWCGRLGSGLGFGSGFLVEVRFGVEEDLIPEVRGHQCRVGGVPGVLPGCLGRLCWRQGAPGSLACGRSFGFVRGFVDEVGGDGGIGG